MIFVFVGDEDYKPVPPLSSDLPLRIGADEDPQAVAYILDEHVFVRGIHRTGNSNWRLAVENGFDPGHVLIHYDNQIVAATDMALALGYDPVDDKAIEIIDRPNGPKGIMNMFNRTESYKPIHKKDILNI